MKFRNHKRVSERLRVLLEQDRAAAEEYQQERARKLFDTLCDMPQQEEET